MHAAPPPPAESDRWFVPLDRRPDAALRLFAVPHAGAGASAFADCARRLPPGVELRALNLPGRQARLREPPRTELEPLVQELAEHLQGAADGRRYALFGYCSGALLAFLVARRLRALGAPPACRLLVASYFPPDVVAVPRLHDLPGDEFWEAIRSLGGMPEELLAVEGYRELFEPALRADFGLLARYRHGAEPPLDLPLTALGGRGDDLLGPAELAGWARHTTAEFSLRLLVAGHWLLEQSSARLAEVLGQELAR